MSDDLRFDMDHFGNPAVNPDPCSPSVGEIKYLSADELKEIVDAAQAHVDATCGINFVPDPRGLFGASSSYGKLAGTSAEFYGTPTAPAKPSVLDSQVGGDHYKKLGIYQPWMVAAACMTAAELRGYMKGTVLAYLMREGDKGADLDIEKIAHTIQLWQEVRKDK